MTTCKVLRVPCRRVERDRSSMYKVDGFAHEAAPPSLVVEYDKMAMARIMLQWEIKLERV